jgi:hypothetical protein
MQHLQFCRFGLSLKTNHFPIFYRHSSVVCALWWSKKSDLPEAMKTTNEM